MDNITAAEHLLVFLNPEKLKFEGREEDVLEELREKVHFVKDLDSAIEHYNSDHGIEAFMDEVDYLDSKAQGIVWQDPILKGMRDEMRKQLSAFPWATLPINEATDKMLNIGDNTERILSIAVDCRLAFGKSSELLERCIELLEHGFLPFGYDEEEELILAFSRPRIEL